MAEKRNAYGVWRAKLKERDHFRDVAAGNRIIYFKDIRWKCVDSIITKKEDNLRASFNIQFDHAVTTIRLVIEASKSHCWL
jgi:hypothetical protein